MVLISLGLGLLGYVGWQLYGTDVVSARRHDQTVGRLQESWSDAGGSARVRTDHGTASAILRVPAFGADFAVPLIEGIDDDALASGIGHFPDSAGPGEPGNFAVAGHRITHGEPLRLMPDLAPGDEIVVETRDAVYRYELDTAGDALRVPFTASWVLGDPPVNPSNGVGPVQGEKALLTLTTCAELFHTDDRLVAFGHLVSVEPR